MAKVKVIMVSEIEMDENNVSDIKEISNQLAKGGVQNVEDIVQDIKVTSLRAEFIQEINCLEVVPEIG
jgi:hypothetical protein